LASPLALDHPYFLLFRLRLHQQQQKILQLIEVNTDKVYSKEGIAISAQSSAAIRVSRYPESLQIAATAFLGLFLPSLPFLFSPQSFAR
jgi:hypothetical protein